VSLIVGLVLAVLVLVALEVFVPGGVLGVCAAVCLLVATGVCFLDYGFFPALILFVATASAALLLAIVQFRWWIRSPAGRGLFLRATVGKMPSAEREEAILIGRDCETLTRLNPSGRVSLDGDSYEAYSRDGYIEAHATVRIVGRDSFKLIIQKT
jgi:membrane-bound serine protease (ClpP class)